MKKSEAELFQTLLQCSSSLSGANELIRKAGFRNPHWPRTIEAARYAMRAVEKSAYEAQKLLEVILQEEEEVYLV